MIILQYKKPLYNSARIHFTGLIVYFQIGFPQRITLNNMEKMIELVNRNIRVSDLYISNYNYHEGDVETNKVNPLSAELSSAFFDLDKGDDFHENTKKAHKFLLENDVAHKVNFSGNGFHLIVFLKLREYINKKRTLFNFQKWLDNTLHLNSENKLFGDLSRIRRLENTYNFKANRFCINLTSDDLNMALDEIKKLASKPQKNITIYGEKLLDIGNFDRDMMFPNGNSNNGNGFIQPEIYINFGDLKLPICISNALSGKAVKWIDRFYVILYLKQTGLNPYEEYTFLKEKWDKEKRNHHNKWFETDFMHMIRERQIEYAFNRDYLFPNKERLFQEGFCTNEKCTCQEINKLF
mgnify:CR=1 FL=1